MKSKQLNKLIKMSLLSVIAFLLMYVELILPMFPEFLKLDISDLPALIGAFALGPVQGVIIELFKSLLHGVFGTKTAFVGELANFLVGGIMVYVAGAIYRKNKSKRTAFIGLLVGSVIMSLSAGILNAYLFLPLYQKVLHLPLEAFVNMAHKVNPTVNNINDFIFWSIIPFNLIKGIFVSVITIAIYKKVSPILHTDDVNEKEIYNKKTA